MSHQAQKKIEKGSPLQRLTALESQAKEIITALESLVSAVNRMSESVNSVSQVEIANKPVIDALVEIIGAQKVVDTFMAQRNKAMREDAARRTLAVEKLIEVGTMVKVDAVTADSIVLTEEKGEDGTVLEPGRTYDSIPTFPPEIAAKLMGVKAGDTVETTKGRVLTVIDVFSLVPETASAVVTDENGDEVESEWIDADERGDEPNEGEG